MNRVELRAHMELSIERGGHSTHVWKDESQFTTDSKHRADHKQYPKFLKHAHPEPTQLTPPNAI